MPVSRTLTNQKKLPQGHQNTPKCDPNPSPRTPNYGINGKSEIIQNTQYLQWFWHMRPSHSGIILIPRSLKTWTWKQSPIQIPASLQNKSLKPLEKATTYQSQREEYRSKAVKTHAPVHKRLTPNAPHGHTAILAPGRPSDKNDVPHAPAQLRLARTHGTHGTNGTKRK